MNLRTNSAARRRGLQKVLAVGAAAILLTTILTSCSSAPPPPAAPLDGRGGGIIAFHSYRDGNSEIYVMNADGSGQTRLTDSPAEDECPALSPDGSLVAFTSNREGRTDIYTIGVDGEGLTRLTHTAATELHPSWTPDGQHIVFSVEGDIWMMDADGDNPRQLTHGAAAELPFVTADGSQIIYSDSSSGSYDIFAVGIDGADPVPLANSSAQEVFGRPSPDGERIAFVKTRNLYVMGQDLNPERLRGSAEDPCWSPDGSQIAFQSNRNGNYEIYVMNADGRATNLTRNSANDFWPSWASIDR